jgi:hypothetical protein
MLSSLQIRRNTGVPAFLRVCIVILAIVAMLGVATGSTSPAHLHAKAPSGGCDICFAAHVASLEAKTNTAILQTPQVFGRITAFSALSSYRLLYRSSFLTRGPPSLSL